MEGDVEIRLAQDKMILLNTGTAKISVDKRAWQIKF
jgi:hypothetical protein